MKEQAKAEALTTKKRALRCLAHSRICQSYRRGWCRSDETCSYKEKEARP